MKKRSNDVLEYQKHLENSFAGKAKSGGAVFSDVEGTLINTSLPEMALKFGGNVFVFTTKQRLQLKSMALLQKVMPHKLRRTIQLFSFLVAMPGQTPAQLEKLNTQFISKALQYVKPKTLERLQQHQHV